MCSIRAVRCSGRARCSMPSTRPRASGSLRPPRRCARSARRSRPSCRRAGPTRRWWPRPCGAAAHGWSCRRSGAATAPGSGSARPASAPCATRSRRCWCCATPRRSLPGCATGSRCGCWSPTTSRRRPMPRCCAPGSSRRSVRAGRWRPSSAIRSARRHAWACTMPRPRHSSGCATRSHAASHGPFRRCRSKWWSPPTKGTRPRSWPSWPNANGPT